MKTIRKATLSFGMVSVGVAISAATEEKDITFRSVHRGCGGRQGLKRVCKNCDEEVAYADWAKGHEVDGGDLVILEDEDFENLPLATSRAIDVLEFVPAEQIDPILYDKVYFLAPDSVAANKPYLLLRDALWESGRVGVVKVAIRSREQLATVRVRDGVLVLTTMLWPDEVRVPEFKFLDESVTLRKQELAMADSLIESMASDFNPDEHVDNYRAALEEVIAAKMEGREVTQLPAVDVKPVVDLFAALQASVDKARADRGVTPITEARSAKKRRAA